MRIHKNSDALLCVQLDNYISELFHSYGIESGIWFIQKKYFRFMEDRLGYSDPLFHSF